MNMPTPREVLRLARRTLGIREGFSLNRSLTNHGTLAPGLDLGSITVQSNYFQYSDGTLAIQLGGTAADTQYDRLVTAGGAFLAGNLKVSFISGYTPAGGSTYAVLAASSITGAFDSIELPQLNPGLVWSANQSLTAFTLTVVGGDFNQNGIVDTADYVMWRNARNTSVATPYSGADGNGDSVVNDIDYSVWRTNLGKKSGGTFDFGSGSGLTLAGVPEPASAVLNLFGVLPVIAYRGRRAAFGRGKSP